MNLLHLYADGDFADESYDFWNIFVICEIEFIFLGFKVILKYLFSCSMFIDICLMTKCDSGL